jgi:hypothetical protein
MKIVRIDYNWYVAHDDGFSSEEYSVHMLGKKYTSRGKVKTVTKIIEYPWEGAGDKWCYEVMFDDGSKERIFNPNKVYYEKR